MSGDSNVNHAASARLSRVVKTTLPLLVSGLLLAYLFSRIDVRVALDHFTLDVWTRFLPPLLFFNVVTLALEARCLSRVAADQGAALPFGTAARIKAACYLLGVLNYGLGAAGLSVLLRRRAGKGLADAAGMVFLIALLDIGSVLLLVGLGAGLLQSETFGVRMGLVLALVGLIVSGFLFLRLPGSLGPLDRIRELEIFRAARTAPIALLLEIGLLRLCFAFSFVALVAALLWSFEIAGVGPFRLAMNVGLMLVVSALPIAAGGLGTGQLAFVALFKGAAPDAELLAASLVFSVGLVVTRSLLGAIFAPEFTREAMRAATEKDADAITSREPRA